MSPSEELSRARLHLQRCQRDLSIERAGKKRKPESAMSHEARRCAAENAVFAALSWVWDAQERAKVSELEDSGFLSGEDRGYFDTEGSWGGYVLGAVQCNPSSAP